LNRGDGSFQGKRNYRTGHGPFAVAIGDLNGDGKGDLAVANFGGNTVSVFVNKGDGSFQAKRDYAAGEYASSVAIGDVNGDGKPDLVVGNHGGTVSVLLNRGDGSFAARRAYRAGGETDSVAIGDVNGDGAPDLATDAGSVLLNRGDGSFAAGRDYGVAGFWVGIGDVNGDGKPDLVAAGLVDPRPGGGSYTAILIISVRLNRGDGTFLARRESRGGRYFPTSALYSRSSGALGDLNGDGKPDLAIACCDKPVVSVLTNSGDGRFLPKLEYRTGRPSRPPEDPSIVLPDEASAVSIGDLDGDGKLDLGVANYGSGTVSVLINAPGLCTVQEVRGMTLATARRMVVRGNCQVGKIRRVYSTAVKRGRVISQRPRFGRVLAGGGRVDLVVSRGRRPS
jgi:hypothetical protein